MKTRKVARNSLREYGVMKKFIVFMMVVVLVMMLTACSGKQTGEDLSENTGDWQEIDFSELEDEFLNQMSVQHEGATFFVYGTNEITENMLTSRTELDGILIERCIGVVTNEERDGDGKILNASDKEHNYISYAGVDFDTPDGTSILTYLVYNPGTDYIDDIMKRFDFILGKGGAKNELTI